MARIAPFTFLIILLVSIRCGWSQELVIAMDDALQSAYDDGWQAGDNGGFGFQRWEFYNFFDPEFSPHAEAQFIAANEHVDVPTNGPAFGQTNGNREFWGYTAWATRPFESPLQVGQTFSIDLDNPVLAPLAESRFQYVYDLHTRNVSDFFRSRPADLLVIDICGGEGWEKLCPFIGKATPSVSFPFANRKQDKQERHHWLDRFDQFLEKVRAVIGPNQKFLLVDDNQFFGTELYTGL